MQSDIQIMEALDSGAELVSTERKSPYTWYLSWPGHGLIHVAGHRVLRLHELGYLVLVPTDRGRKYGLSRLGRYKLEKPRKW